MESPTKFERKYLRNYSKSFTRSTRAHFYYNGVTFRALRSYHPAVIKAAIRFKALAWPMRLAHYVTGRKILDVGCGMSLVSVGFVTAGVSHYVGCDPLLKFDSDVMKDNRLRGKTASGWTPRKLMRLYPQVEYHRTRMEDFDPGDLFDIAVLHNATEHLINIESVFQSLRERLRPGGLLIFNHHNFACWSGHHAEPKSVSQIVPGDPEQAKVIDWEHLRRAPEGYVKTGLNRIRLGDLRALTGRYFAIQTWEEEESKADQLERLTDEILRRTPGYDRRELSVQHVFCVAARRE